MKKSIKTLLFSTAITLTALAGTSCSSIFNPNDTENNIPSPSTKPESTDNAQNNDGQNSNQNTDPIPSNERTIRLSDSEPGFAAVTLNSETVTTVSTKDELISALKKGGIIYVNGMIDLSEGYMPSEAGAGTEKLDALVKEKSDGEFETYIDFKNAYAKNCTSKTNDKDKKKVESTYGSLLWKLNEAYASMIKIRPTSNTTIIGITPDAGFKGGSVTLGKINSVPVSNITIRNLTIQDSYDPFPHHEKDDQFNAQFDTVSIQDGANNIWIDHCTFRDTLGVSKVSIQDGSKEKWQTYDGLLDMKSENTTNITVSWCKFENHDKTMLIGSSDTEWDGCNRKVTLACNYFYNCGQRLPMVRQTLVHVYNNYYDADSNAKYTQQYAIGIRNKSKVYSQSNYFGNGIKYAYSGTSNTSIQGNLYAENDFGATDSKIAKDNFKSLELTANSVKAIVGYNYTLLETAKVKEVISAGAGAGCNFSE